MLAEKRINRLGVECILRTYCPSSTFSEYNGDRVAEFAGPLPLSLINILCDAGATVYDYGHKGNPATVVVF